MTSALTFEALKDQVLRGETDTVLACFVDMQGRLMGKRFHARHFVDGAWNETHCCNYLLATDLEMETPGGFASASWQTGYGDYIMKPDLSTLRPAPWLEGTVLVLCDVLDHHGHPVPHSPRAILNRQVERLKDMGFDTAVATELEFYLFEKDFETLRKEDFRDLAPISGYNEDYHIFQTTKEEHILRPLRNHLYAAGIPVEGTKGEAGPGQGELNIRYASALLTADYHTLAKHAIKEVAWQQNASVSFLAKWHPAYSGSSSHVHQSLLKDGKPAFFDESDPLGMSSLMKHYLAGLLTYAPDYTYFLAPYVNSYKRFAKGTFAPTRTIWSVDNRTAGFRLCAAGTNAVRIECRIGGSDLNPYLAIAAQLAAGIKGIAEGLELPPPAEGDTYEGDSGFIPRNLRDARTALLESSMLRAAMGDDVVEHYARAAEVEMEDFDRVITGYELARGFERA